MSINTEDPRTVTFNGDGLATVFPFGFKVFHPSETRATSRSPLHGDQWLINGVNFTAELNLDQDNFPGGTVTLFAPIAVGDTLIITAYVPMTQLIKLTNSGGFYPETINDGFDKLTILIQQILNWTPTSGSTMDPSLVDVYIARVLNELLADPGRPGDFVVDATRFLVVLSGSGAPGKAVFGVGMVGGIVTVGIRGDLVFDGTLYGHAIVAGSIAADRLNVNHLSAITADMGELNAGTIRTSADISPTSGWRVELSSIGDMPIWYGHGTKSTANAKFYLDTAGNAFFSGALSGATGSFSGDLTGGSIAINSGIFGVSSTGNLIAGGGKFTVGADGTVVIRDSYNNITFASGGAIWDFVTGKPLTLAALNSTDGGKLAGIDSGATRNVYKGIWAVGTVYAPGDIVLDDYGNGWSCIQGHTSGAIAVPAIPLVITDPARAYWTLYMVKGVDAISVILSNDTHVLSADVTGLVGSYANSGTTIQVYDGSREMIYDAAGTTPGTWQVTTAPTNITVGTKTKTGNYLTVGNQIGVANAVDVATITYTVLGKRYDGSGLTATAQQSFAKSRSGISGVDGQPGPQGPSVMITPSRVASFTAQDGTLDPSQADIVFTAAVSGVTSPAYGWTFSGFQTSPTNSGSTSQSITALQFGTSKSAIVTCTVNGIYVDKITVVRLEKTTAAPGATVGATFDSNISGQITPGNVSTYIANGAIKNLQVGVGEIDTLRIRGAAVTVPVTCNSGQAFGGRGLTRISFCKMYLDSAGVIYAHAISSQGYGHGIKTWYMQLRLVDELGGIVAISDAGGLSVADTISLAVSNLVGAGWFSIELWYQGQDGNVHIDHSTIFAMGAKR